MQPASSLTRFFDPLVAFLPTLTGGLLVVAVGVVAGWIAKRALIRILIWLRLDRLGGRSGWRAAFGKGDVRAAMYQLFGNLAMAAVVLLFLDNALQIWGLTIISDRIGRMLVYLPNLAVVALIVGIGLLIANFVGDRVERTLVEEGVDRAPLVGLVVKGALQTVAAALALWQLGLARQIVLAGFIIAFGAVGVAFALAVGIGTARAIQDQLGRLFEKRRDE